MSSIWDFIGPDGQWINPVDDEVIDNNTAYRTDLNDAADKDRYASLLAQSTVPSNYWAARSLLDRFPANFGRDEVVASPALPADPKQVLNLGWQGVRWFAPHLTSWEYLTTPPEYPAFPETPGKMPNVDSDPRVVGILSDLTNLATTFAPTGMGAGPIASVTRRALTPVAKWVERESPNLAQYLAKTSGPIAFGSSKGAKDLMAGRPLERKYWQLVDPPNKPPRPFRADYPIAPQADAEGRLLEDIEGRPLIAKYVVGRRTVGGADNELSRADLDAINRELFRTRPRAVGNIRNSELTPTRLRDGTYTYRVRVDKTLSPAEQDMFVARETANGINTLGEVPSSALYENEARRVFDDLNNRRKIMLSPEASKLSTAIPKWGPEQSGFNSRQITNALQDESMRAYMTNPNYMKTTAPDQAAIIRHWVNSDPTISKIVQFNSIAAMLGLPAITEWPETNDKMFDPAARPRNPHQDEN